MSIINLHCKEVVWGEAIPGVLLVQAKEVDSNFPYVGMNNVPMLENCFGLVIKNDPFIVFSSPPQLFKGNLEFYYENNLKNELEILWKYHHELYGSLLDMHYLMNCVIADGYQKERYHIPGFFVSHKIAKFIQNNQPAEIFDKI